MALILHRNGMTKPIPSGFSGTTLCFGPIPALMRGQIGPALIIFFTCGLGWLFYMFKLNEAYLEKMQGEGWVTTEQMETKQRKEKEEKQEALNQQMMMMQALKN